MTLAALARFRAYLSIAKGDVRNARALFAAHAPRGDAHLSLIDRMVKAVTK